MIEVLCERAEKTGVEDENKGRLWLLVPHTLCRGHLRTEAWVPASPSEEGTWERTVRVGTASADRVAPLLQFVSTPVWPGDVLFHPSSPWPREAYSPKTCIFSWEIFIFLKILASNLRSKIKPCGLSIGSPSCISYRT